jgi:signal transduction histidine kinase
MSFPARNQKETWLAAKLNTPLRMALFALFVAGMSYVLAFAGDLFYQSPQIAALLWPSNAFQVAVMLLLPRRVWPLLIAAHVAGGFLHAYQIHLTVLMMVVYALADVMIFIVAGLGLDHVFGGISCLDSFKAFAKYFFIAVLLAPAVSAFVAGFGCAGPYWLHWRIWFLLNALTFLTFGTAIFGWLRPLPVWPRKYTHWQLEAAALFGALVLREILMYFVPWRATPLVVVYSLIPLLLWAALRFGSVGVSTSMVLVAVISSWATVHQRGPAANATPEYNSLSLALFLVITAIPFLLLAVEVEERERARLIQRALGGRLIYAQEQERKRIARELHDDISQKLALITLELQKANHLPKASVAEMKRHLAEVQKHCSEVALDIHSVSRQLHSSNLEYLGIAGAIGSFCREFSEKYDLVIEFTERDVPKRIADDSALCLFRIAQEALTNARKYSGIQKLHVELTGKADEVRLTVRDRGVGFDVEQVRRTGGLGLVSMEERVNLVRGSLSVHSRPGAGTTIVAVVPIGAASDLFYTEGAPEEAPEVS